MNDPIRSLSRGLILLLALVSALGPIAMQILLPAIPIIKDSFAVSTGVAQLTLSLSMAAIAVATLVYGPLSDRYGRKPVLMCGITLTIIGSIACVMAPSIALLIAGRILQAAGGAVGLVVARAIVRDVYDARESASVIATLVMVMVVMPMLSPAIGGELMVRFDWHAVFWLVAALALLMLVLLARHLPETLHTVVPFSGVKDLLRTYATLLRDPIFRGYGLCVAFVSMVFFSFISAAPEIMVSVLKRPATEYGYYFISVPLGFMAGNYLTRHFGQRIGLHRMIDYGSRIAIAGIVLAMGLHAAGLQHPAALFFPVALAIFGNGITLPNAQAGAINAAPRLAGSASGLTGFMQMGFSALAAQAVALIFNGTVYPMLSLMLAGSTLSLLSFRLLVPKGHE
ncbi:MAG: multidrug effflux MFS transporter [Pseudomonadales bacterium]|nr:multidrug effflux MFS transporter [Pseudomonadales bacterium]MCP5329751.1 multidrug effflux MFS transporter [Pseudomonadales bacterium]MCP5343710.1 multidrug effflux MFS transporter [Pseudomonadales bacterium]